MGRARPMRASGLHFCGFADLEDLKIKGGRGFAVPPLGVVGSGGAGLAAAGQIGHYAGGSCRAGHRRI